MIGNLGCTCRGACIVVPGEAFDPAAVLETVARRALHGALRRADHVHRQLEHPRFAEFDLSSLRTGIMGGARLPGGGDAAGAIAHAHAPRSPSSAV